MDTHPSLLAVEKGDSASKNRRKYATEKAAKKAGYRGHWRAESWPECLYRKLSNGRFFYRARSGKSRAFLQLQTDDLKIAKRKLRDVMAEVTDLRDSGQNASSADFKTLGACAAEMERVVARSTRGENTRLVYATSLARLRRHWQLGKFDSFPADRVNLDTILDLRNHLKTRVVFVVGRITPNVRNARKRTGYSNNVVNQTLWALRACLDVAVSKRVRVSNPFVTRSALEETINLPKGRRTPDLPSTATMERLFEAMRAVPDRVTVLPNGTKARAESAPMRARREWYANRAADLAQFLAYTGCRHEEALDIRAGYDGKNMEGFLYVDGTKSEQSKRDVPISVPGLRPLLNRLKSGKEPGDRLFPEDFDCLQAMARACKRQGIPKLVQHELRHYFSTVMLEEGVSFALLAGWLGHSDGGVLAAKTYGHIRNTHAQQEAQRVAASLARKYARGAADTSPVADNVIAFSSALPSHATSTESR